MSGGLKIKKPQRMPGLNKAPARMSGGVTSRLISLNSKKVTTQTKGFLCLNKSSHKMIINLNQLKSKSQLLHLNQQKNLPLDVCS